MPLVMLAGHPCSGKTTIARQLAAELGAAGLSVKLVSENDLFKDRNASYEGLFAEKNTRAKLRSEVDRHISKSTTVILDSLNNIKGYRYELWCIARSVGTRCCVLWVDTPAEMCREWNSTRAPDAAYSAAVFDDLAGRFEPPNSQTRWDTPLYTATPGPGADVGAALAAIVRGLTQTAAAHSVTVGPNATVSKDLRPNMATVTTQLSHTNLLYELDQAAQAVIKRITDAQSAAGAGAAGRVCFDDGGEILLGEPVTLPDLRRLKRGFVSVATSGMYTKLQAGAASRTFVAYLQENLRGVVR